MCLKQTQGMTMKKDLQTDNIPVIQKEHLYATYLFPPSPEHKKNNYKQKTTKHNRFLPMLLQVQCLN